MENRNTYYASAGKTVCMTVIVTDSSVIESLEWNNWSAAYGSASEGELTVRFHNGTVYVYENVSLTVLWSLANSTSVGKAYNEQIKDKYEFRKLELASA